MKACRACALVCLALAAAAVAQGPGQSQSSSSSSSSKQKKGSSARLVPDIGAGTVANGVYRNRALGLTCKIPAGWVLRTEEMNARSEESEDTQVSQTPPDPGHPSSETVPKSAASDRDGLVLLAAFSRPPAAKGEDVNSSIVIAAEKVETYPGLKEAAQYFGPLTEVAKAQGLTADEDPYEIQMGAKVVVRGDFHKDVGSRVMRQSTVVFLAQGYVVSITAIGGTENEMEELLDGIEFVAAAQKK